MLQPMTLSRTALLAVSLGLGLALALPPGAAQTKPLRVGEPAPAIRARPLDSDEEISLATYRGQPLVLAFVASWCHACRQLAPHLSRLQQAHGGAGLQVVSMSHESRDLLQRHRASFPAGLPLLQCSGHTSVSYGADRVPTTVLIDRQGVVRGRWQGVSGAIVQALERGIQRALAP